MELHKIHAKILKCRKCRLGEQAQNAVPGEGNWRAGLMLVGQNPGAKEDQTGKPFVGQAGRYLDKVLERNHISRAQIFITSIVKHKTPENRKPKEDEINACLPYLLQQIQAVNPHTIVLMGTVAWLTPRDKNRKYIETYHPAAAMRFPKIRDKFEADFRNLPNIK